MDRDFLREFTDISKVVGKKRYNCDIKFKLTFLFNFLFLFGISSVREEKDLDQKASICDGDCI